MTDVDIMIKALRLAWIPRFLNPDSHKWKSIPDYFKKKNVGLNFLPRCNYDAKYLDPKCQLSTRTFYPFFLKLNLTTSMNRSRKQSFF